MKKILSLVLVMVTLFTFVGCEKAPDVAVKDIITNIQAEVKEIEGLVELDLKSEELTEFDKMTVEAFGINPEDISEGIIKYPMINLAVDEVIVLKAVDESKIEAIKEALNKHVEAQIKNFENYVPKNSELVKNHILKTQGNYILFVVSENAEKIESIFDNALNQ